MDDERFWRGIAIPRKLMAVAAGFGLAAGAALAAVGHLAETPAASVSSWIAGLGSGSSGQLRGLPIDAPERQPARVIALSRKALAREPLSFDPFFAIAATGFRGAKGVGTATDAALLREALRRDGRATEPRQLLLRYTLTKGDLTGAIDQLAALSHVSSGPVEQLMTALGQVIGSEAQVDEAVAALRPHPELYVPFLRGFAAAVKPAALVTHMVRTLPPSAIAGGESRRLVISQMIRVQAYADARRLWASGDQGGAGDFVHSPDFADVRRPPPFNWALTVDETGAAERLPGGGVSIDYFGRSPGPLVSQLITLPPGRYVATLRYRTSGGQPGTIALRVACPDAPEPLGELPLLGRIGTDASVRLGFTVPETGCGGQTLAVSGRAAETRDAQQVTLMRLDVAQDKGK